MTQITKLGIFAVPVAAMAPAPTPIASILFGLEIALMAKFVLASAQKISTVTQVAEKMEWSLEQ